MFPAGDMDRLVAQLCPGPVDNGLQFRFVLGQQQADGLGPEAGLNGPAHGAVLGKRCLFGCQAKQHAVAHGRQEVERFTLNAGPGAHGDDAHVAGDF